MSLPPVVIVVVLLIFGFLSGSTAYFYNKSRQANVSGTQKITAFNGEVTKEEKSTGPDKVDELTKPADPKGRLVYPANVYVVQPKETLFAIGNKFAISWQMITLANGLVNENVVQADYPLVIPKLNQNTDYYRVNLVVNEDKATQLNQELRKADSNELFDPINAAKKQALPYFGVKGDDVFSLLEQDLSQGTAVVEVKKADRSVIIGLIQPKIKGDKGFWATVYIENQE